MDFSDYTPEQLRRLREGVDAAAAPELWAAVNAELLRRADNHNDSPQESDRAVPGRHTPHDGVRGSLEAWSGSQPVSGRGYLEASPELLTIGGWQRTWLGLPMERALQYPVSRVRNVVRIGQTLHLQLERRVWFPRRVAFTPDSPPAAAQLVAQLPTRTTRSFAARGQELLAFEALLRERCPIAWTTALLVLLNVLAFLAIAISAGTAQGLSFLPLLLGFANVPGLVLQGQWWRLLTALFVHGGLLHLALNMWVLWHVGRQTERLFGSGRFLLIYFAAGIAGGLFSIAWDPERWSVGASGAVFGVLGAFVAALAHPESHVPRSTLRSHWVPTLLFVAFNLLSGAFQVGIDNAAHVGGFVAGLALGFTLAPSMGNAERTRLPLQRAAATGLLLVLVALLLWASGSLHRPLSPSDRFLTDHRWYTDGEARNGIAWQKLASLASAGMISDAQIAERFRKDILPFWEDAVPRLDSAAEAAEGDGKAYLQEVARYAGIRRDTVQAVIDSADHKQKEGDSGRVEKLTVDAQHASARLERLSLLWRAGQLDAGLRQRLPTSLHIGEAPQAVGRCVRTPYIDEIRVATTDSVVDGPVQRDIAFCRAQGLYRADNFQALERDLREAVEEPFSLQDGGTRLGALSSGLYVYFQFGPETVEQNLARIARWHRAVPDSWFTTLMESWVFSAAAWQARGGGYAREVSGQAWQLFKLRTEMAHESLEQCDENCRRNPLWYAERIDVALDRSTDKEIRMRYLKDGLLAHPSHRAIYRNAMRTLMPRWGGSYEEVAALIEEAAAEAPEPERDIRYAELVWMYADLEDELANVFEDAGMNWERFQRGLSTKMDRHPESDLLLNAMGRFACEADSPMVYQVVRPDIGKRPSATAWTNKVTVKGCDAKFSYTEDDG